MKTYTQEEMDEACKKAYDKGCEDTAETYEYESY